MSDRRPKIKNQTTSVMITHEWHDRYIDLLADPQDKRNNVDFFSQEKVHEQTFYKWLRRFREDIHEEANRRLRTRRNELRTKAWKRLEDQFGDKSGGNVIKALELFFKLNGDLIERTENRTEMISPEMKKIRLAQFLAEIKSKSSNLNEKAQPEANEIPQAGEGGLDASSIGEGDEPRDDSSSGRG